MTPKQEAILGLIIWFKGVFLMIGMGYFQPHFRTEGICIGLLLVVLGVTFIYWAATDYLGDDFHANIRKEYKG